MHISLISAFLARPALFFRTRRICRNSPGVPLRFPLGTILLDVDHQDQPVNSFKKYVDAILDLLLVGQSPGIKDTLVDRHQVCTRALYV